MKVMRGIVVVAALASALPAHAATTDPLQVIYLFSGVIDNGGSANAGVATSVHCTSFSSVTETLQIVVRDETSSVKGNANIPIPSSQSRTISTHSTLLHAEAALSTGALAPGALGVLSTSINVVCTAQVLDASSAVPSGFALHPVRFSPIPGTQE